MRMTIALLAAVLVLGGSANAQTVKCAHAVTRGEKLICSVKHLRGLDLRTNGHYMMALNVAEPPDYFHLKRTQKTFVAARRSCRSVACLEEVFKRRRYELRDVIYE